MIDIRELTLNSHVLYRGERVKIESIDVYGAITCSPRGFGMHETDSEHLDPIPITEELLKELGFVERDGEWDYDIEKVWESPIDNNADDWEYLDEDDFIQLIQYDRGIFRLQYLGTLAYVKYLHNLETFIYITE